MEVQVNGVSKIWGVDTDEPVMALDSVTHTFSSHKFTCLLGPSGCGKSTLLQIIAGLSSLSGGQIDVVDPENGGRAELGEDSTMVWQNFNLFPWLNVIDNIAFGLKMDGVNKTERNRRAQEYVHFVGLKGFETKLPRQLSGGMKQRVGLARALIKDPDILLMDEPFGALDAQTKFVMQEEVQRLYLQTHKTVIFVTHAIDESILLADEVVVMTARPGCIKAVVPIDLPRPRSLDDVNSHAFGELFNKIYHLIKEEVEKTMMGEVVAS
jgi:NitT/TauT family transport system ATP-binding protein